MVKIAQAGTTLAASGTFQYGGVLIADAGSATAPQGAVISIMQAATNDGTVLVEGGPAVFGSVHATGAAVLNQGTFTNTGLVALQGGAYGLRFGQSTVSGARLINNGVLLNAGTLSIGGAQPDYGIQTYVSTGAVLRDNGVLTNSGLLAVAGAPGEYDPGVGGTATVAGLLTNDGTIALADSGPYDYRHTGTGGVLTVLGAGTLVNAGQLTMANANGASGPTLADFGRLSNTGAIAIGNGDTLTVASSGVLTNTGAITGGGSLLNQGVLASGGGGLPTGRIAAARLVNNGVVQVASGGVLAVDSAVYASAGTGLFDLSAGGTLMLNGAVSANQEVRILGAHATLALGATSTFAGVLDDVQWQTTLDFLHLAVTSVTASGSHLTVDCASGVSFDLALTGPVSDQTSWQLSSDGRGGTNALAVGPADDPVRSSARPHPVAALHLTTN